MGRGGWSGRGGWNRVIMGFGVGVHRLDLLGLEDVVIFIPLIYIDAFFVT